MLDRDSLRPLMTQVLAWPDDTGKRIKGRAALILELLASGRDPERVSREARGLARLLRDGHVPDDWQATVRAILAHIEDGAALTTRDLATRIEAVYRRHTGASTGYGAQAWFARRAYSHPTTVYRWIRAGHLPGPALGLLEALEQAGELPHCQYPPPQR